VVAQNDLLRRREAAKAARAKGAVPVIEDSNIDAPNDQAASAPAVIRPPQNRSVALPMTGVDQSRQLTERDLIMPKLKIAQGLSKVVQTRQVELGHWYHTALNEDLGTSVLFIPVDMRMSRSYYETGKGLLCRSFDLVQGEGDPGILCQGEPDEYYMPESERGCELRLWGPPTTKGGKSTKPKCGLNYNYIGLVLLDGDPEGRVTRGLLTLRGTASRTAKDINTLVVNLSESVQNPDWSQSILKLSLESRQNSFGTFGVPIHERVGATAEYPRLLERVEEVKSMVDPGSYRATLESDTEPD
jgi:hypothetical protein